ncbi:hypothetical protein CW731_09520 [Polaribacter sp. ALD11]|uniref:PorP/SprF family type IX secretion system membrane protein n=1 Tax=Polaribacter sp. ALD11 TaxID=2058137 RepID=UPI000C3175DD|nr:PorP/SprF family type IX secretion system membrane protein [Polaribacter sp. ALD11]AUC85514.1 hypothetical protein CW731_09520 [Polaribacter sp. ALD11]
MFKASIYIAVLVLFTSTIFSQSTQEELYNNFSSHNFLKHNRFFLNPTFSVARENTTSLSFLSRNKFSDFDDSPQLYVGSYSGRISEKVGVGLGVFQQNYGIFKNFGVLLNYGYQVKLSDKNALAFGFNFMYSRNGIDRSKVVVSNPDPFLVNFQERPIINFQPAVNLTLGNFDLGVFLENLMDYDLKAYEFITPFSEKTFSGHLMYTKPFNNNAGILKDGKFQLLSVVRKRGKSDARLTGSLLLDLPKVGWVQSTYDDLFGAAFGIGFNLSEKISIGFVYEKGKNNLGVTNEISLTYFFGKHDYVKINEDVSSLEKNSVLNKLAEIEDKKINEYQTRQDSINQIQKEEAQRKHLQLLKLIKSNEQNKPVETVSNKKRDSLTKKIKLLKSDPLKKEVQVPLKKEIKKTPIRNKKIEVKNEVLHKLKVSNGYYVVANYYSKESNAKVFMQSMIDRNFDAKYFKHPKKNFYYVYLDSFSNNKDAQKAVSSKLNNKYSKLLSIVNVNDTKVGVVATNSYKKEEKTEKRTITKPLKKKSEKPVNIRKMKSNANSAPGYYLIVSVFSKKKNTNQFLEKLTKEGLNPKYFVYPKNNYRYIYLSKVGTKKEALELYYSDINGSYTDDKWIMHIE